MQLCKKEKGGQKEKKRSWATERFPPMSWNNICQMTCALVFLVRPGLHARGGGGLRCYEAPPDPLVGWGMKYPSPFSIPLCLRCSASTRSPGTNKSAPMPPYQVILCREHVTKEITNAFLLLVWRQEGLPAYTRICLAAAIERLSVGVMA